MNETFISSKQIRLQNNIKFYIRKIQSNNTFNYVDSLPPSISSIKNEWKHTL